MPLAAVTDRTLSILVIAPQPFMQNRGTPIAVRLLVEELARLGHQVHLLVFHEGEEVELAGVRVHRIRALPIKDIPPSFSWKKLVCDVFLFSKAAGLLRRHPFDVVHAVEESAFMAMVLKGVFGIPYIYDMDSSLALQLADKFALLKPCRPLLDFCERLAVRASNGVVAVCRSLEDIAVGYAPDKPVVRLEDISLLDGGGHSSEEMLRERYGISGPIMLYVGNLEGYQGIDLLLESFRIAREQGCRGNMVIIGGTEATIDHYRKKAEDLQISATTFFVGPRPVSQLGHFLAQADILLSPRIQGNNTPMKLYSYLDSGKVVLATDLPTHTQVLTGDFACLVQPTRESMAAGMARLLADPGLCRELGEKGRNVARENYSIEAFRKKLGDFYDHISATLPEAVQSDFAHRKDV